MVREYLKLSPGPPSPVLPSEHPQQEVRGPAGGGEVGSLCDNPTQQQVLTGGPAGWDPPSSPLLMWGRGWTRSNCLLLLWWHSSPGFVIRSLQGALRGLRFFFLISVPSVIRGTPVLASAAWGERSHLRGKQSGLGAETMSSLFQVLTGQIWLPLLFSPLELLLSPKESKYLLSVLILQSFIQFTRHHLNQLLLFPSRHPCLLPKHPSPNCQIPGGMTRMNTFRRNLGWYSSILV